MTQTATQVKDIKWLDLPDTPEKANVNDVFKGTILHQKPKAKVTTKTPVKKKKVGVVGISKAENEQLGRLLKWVALELDWDTIPNEVLTDPESLTKLFGRFKTQ